MFVDIVLPAVPPEMTSKSDIDSQAKEANAISFCAKKRVLNCHAIHIFIGIALSVLLASSKSLRESNRIGGETVVVLDNETSIFVGIASYVDSELDRTLELLFAQAKEPARVHVGVVLQEHQKIRDSFPLMRWRNHRNVRMLEFEPKVSHGAGWARSKIATLYRGEKYYLQLDSHHMFVRSWDVVCIELLNQLAAKVPKPILTTYLTSYPEDAKDVSELVRQLPWRMTAGYWMKPFRGILPKKIQYLPLPIPKHILMTTNGDPQPTPFLSAHFVFVHATWLKEVPYDPLMYFDGEEDSLAMRSYTNGYDMFYPTVHIAFHLYERKNSTKHWHDHPEMFKEMSMNSMIRLKAIIQTRGGVAGDWQKLGLYGLGAARSIVDYQRFAGVDYTRMYITSRARYGETLGKQPTGMVPRLWVHKDGHFQMTKRENNTEFWEEWKHGEAVEGKVDKNGECLHAEAFIVTSKWIVISRDAMPPRPNLNMIDVSRGIEMQLTPEGCFYRYPNSTDFGLNWTFMAYGHWM